MSSDSTSSASLHRLASAISDQCLLSVRLSVDYSGKPGVLRNASFHIMPGEILALVGESGAGKSTMALSILRLLEFKGGSVSGEIAFRGRDLTRLSQREMRRIRGREIALVPQSPLASLNPALRIGAQLKEAWRAHSTTPITTTKLLELLENVSLPAEEPFLRRYPRELSVGLAQRVLIAMAILHRPALIIGDEPTSALDMITQWEILQLLARLNRERNLTILYISHDLLSIASICHRVAILYNGEVVETGPTERIFRNPAHPYTRRLIAAVPRNPFAEAAAERALVPMGASERSPGLLGG